MKRTRTGKLLEPMNPFERRLIHTKRNDVAEIGTRIKGQGLHKQVCVSHRGDADP